jgi:hypothetical protein
MVNFYNSLSPTTKLLIQSFLAVLGSVLAGAITAAYQSYILSDKLDLAVLVNISLATFALLFGKAMHDWIPAHAQQLIQAGKDNEAMLQDALQRSQNVTSAVIATQGSLVQSTSAPAQQQPIDVQALSQQLAVNLMNMASKLPAQSLPITNTSAAAQDAYEDPLKISMKLPAYTPPVVNQATQQVPFSVPARPQSAIMP